MHLQPEDQPLKGAACDGFRCDVCQQMQVFKAKDQTVYFWIEHWCALLDACALLGAKRAQLRPAEAHLAFAWSQMLVRDELKKRQRAVSLRFFDFLEARTPAHAAFVGALCPSAALLEVRALLLVPVCLDCALRGASGACRTLLPECVQALCRVADRLSLPTHRKLQQYYGGRARVPAAPWAD
jgi:hypothetical protein